MKASEKRLLIIFCVALGCFLGYYIVKGAFLDPAAKAKEDYTKYKNMENEFQATINSEVELAEQWRKYAERTFSFDKNQAFDWFGEALKETAAANGFDAPEIKKKTSTKKLGTKSGIEAISYEITVKADYTKAIQLLRAMYDSKYVSRVQDVQLTPEPREGRNVVKLSFQVQTLILPKVAPSGEKGSGYFASVKPKLHEAGDQFSKWRQDFPPADAFAVLQSRNIFREYMPPPPNSVIVENQDPKLVGVKATYFWDNDVSSESQIGIKPNQQENIVGKGDEVEIHVAYADGTEFRQRHVFNDGKAWTYKVPSHTVIEPKIINLAIDSRDKEETRFTLKITGDDGKQKTLPEMVIGPETKLPLGDFEAKEIVVSAVYPGMDRTVPEKHFRPGTSEQVYLIPERPKPNTPVVENTHTSEPPREDAPPASGYIVSGLLTYHDSYEDKDKQEMVVNGPEGREIFTAGNMEDRIDGGVLVSVCPLGGIVFMPDTGNYYLYPRGEGFEMRARLNAERPEQLAMAIQEWSEQN